jgi:hypothetical protein
MLLIHFFRLPLFTRKALIAVITAQLAALFLLLPAIGHAQTAAPATTVQSKEPDPTLAPPPPPVQHGRKYKPMVVTSHIEVFVTGGAKSKPVPNAMVVFHPLSSSGKDQGSYEVKTDDDGKAVIDVIPQHTTVILQVVSSYEEEDIWPYATYGETYQIDELNRTINVKLEHPRTQYSTYTNDNDRPADDHPGVLEPAKPVVPQPPPTAGALHDSAAASSKHHAQTDLTGITSPDISPNTAVTPPPSK